MSKKGDKMAEGRGHRRTVGLVFMAGLLLGTTPAVARVVADFARNAGKVDGFSAVGADTSRRAFADKVVATDGEGHLPNHVIERAPDSRRLDNEIAEHYEDTRCELGISADALVPKDVPATPTVVGDAFVFSGKGHNGDPLLYDCNREKVRARHVGPGTYRLNFGHAVGCSIAEGGLSTLVTVKSEQAPLVANSHTVCEGDEGEEEVRIVDLDGIPVDASFSVLLLTPLPQPEFG